MRAKKTISLTTLSFSAIGVPCLFLSFFLYLNPIHAQSVEIEKKYYPEPSINFPTPAFVRKKKFTNHKTMLDFLHKITDGDSRVQLSYIGKSQKKKQIPILFFSSANSDQKNAKDKVRVWFQGGLHGNELASTEGLLYLIYQLLKDKELSSYLKNLSIAIVPMANVDGYQAQSRYAANGCDLNRDQTKLECKESVLLKTAFHKFSPEIAIDFHEYKPYRSHFSGISTQGVVAYFDVMFLYSGNLNIPFVLRDATEKLLVSPTKQFLKSKNFSVFNYASTRLQNTELYLRLGGQSSRSSASNFALSNSLSVLMEIRGVNLGRINFKRRVLATYLSAKSYLQNAITKKVQIKAALRQALRENNALKANIYVKTKPDIAMLKYPVIDIEKKEKMIVKLKTHRLLKQKPILTRKRPSAYLILSNKRSKGWISRAIEKISLSGIKFEKLEKKQTLSIESYFVTDTDFDSLYTKSNRVNNVKTELRVQKKEFPAGTFFISMKQKNANLLAELLEPEAQNSFVRNSIIKVAEGKEIPIYRYMNKK